MSVKKRNSVRSPKITTHPPKNTTRPPKISAFCNKNKGIGDREKGIGDGSSALIASLEAQMASIEKQIALLKEGIGDRGKDSIVDRNTGGNREDVKTETLSPNPYSLSPSSALPKIGPNPLPAPELAALTTMGDAVFVRWSTVAGATGYSIDVSDVSEFADPLLTTSTDGATSITLTGFDPDTTYFIRVRANGTGANANSAYSNVQSIRTLPEGMAGTNDEIVTHLQNWLEQQQTEFQNVVALVPRLENTELNSTDRRRLRGSGVRRYGFVEKVLEVSADFPQIWPAFGIGKTELNESVQEIDVLRNLLVWFRFAARTVQDLLLIAGDDAFRAASAYYTSAREGARRKDTEATQVFDMLRLFWRRRRRTSEEPTIPEVERDVRALLRGSKDGTVTVSNESDSIVKGEKVIIDNTQRKPRGGVKVIETGEISVDRKTRNVK